MKMYKINTVINFGKFNGKSIREVINIQPSYLNWCVINLDHFHIPKETIQDIKSMLPTFSLSKEAAELNDAKYLKWTSENKKYEDYTDYEDVYSPEDLTDWTNYNDNLDMDQQSIEFWNQF